MDRRKALRNMGLALGYTVATPTLIGIVQSCKKEAVLTWVPEFLTKAEGFVLTQLVDIILPKTDTPSASELQVHMFIDRFAKEAMEKDQQDFFKMAMGKFVDKAIKDSGSEKMENLSPEALESALATALKVTKEVEETNNEALEAYNLALQEGNPAVLDEGIARYAFASNLRGLAIWGYKTTEFVGENVLNYLPVPGEYIGCGDAQELSGGKAWSLS